MTDYRDLITSEHAKRPKFVGVIQASTDPFAEGQAALGDLVLDYDLDSAVGAQLDAVGLWVGIGREILTPLEGVYFSWGVPGVGWGEGYWRGPFDPSQGITVLSDEFYRLLLRATIALNHWDGTLGQAVAAIAPLFPANFVYIQDNQDMTISVAMSGPTLNVILSALLTGGYLALKPVGVRINYYFPSAPTGPVFGFGADNDYIGGWGHGSWAGHAPFAG